MIDSTLHSCENKARIEAVLLDLSGVLYVGEDTVPGAAAAIARLYQAGLPVRAVTNTTRRPRHAIIEKLRRLDLPLAENAVFTAVEAANQYIDAARLHPWLLVHPALADEFDFTPVDPPDAVLIADAGEGFVYQRLNEAFRLLIDGAPLLAMGDNRYFRDTDGLSLDCGPFVRALEYAAAVKATVLGKPARAFFHAAIAGFNCPPERVVMVGDDAQADVCGAIDAGLQGLLVRTGKYRPADDKPVRVAGAAITENITTAVQWIIERAH